MNRHVSLIIFLFFILSSVWNIQALTQTQTVILIEYNNTIDQSSVEILQEAIKEAENRDAQAIILLLNTPGGILQDTFEIAEIIRGSHIPVVGYVYPNGATAWSAGTLILLSTHVAVMAQHSIIGSCQPVEVGLEGTRVVNDSKTINALVEWIQERAIMYERNATLAGEFVTKNRNVNATIALQLGVIELVASNIDSLLDNIDGLNVNTSIGTRTLFTKNAEQIFYTPSIGVQLLKTISNPILSSLLLMLGILALIFGISSPGFGAEVFGVIAILLSLIGSGFAISSLSIIFIVIGVLLLLIELFVTPGFGIIGIGGMICLIIGSIFLVPSYPNGEWLISMDYIENALIVLLVIVVLLAIFFAFLLYKVVQIRNKKKAIGTFEGEQAVTVDRITPEIKGYVRYKGELWQARSTVYIEPNTKVLILQKDESTLIVKPLEE